MTTKKQTISLAVMPFDNLTGDVEQDYFSHRFVEDLIIDLSRYANLGFLLFFLLSLSSLIQKIIAFLHI
jgi:TolB-like protein